MHRITSATTDLERKLPSSSKADKTKDLQCELCDKKGHLQKKCRSGGLTCYFCKEKGHCRTDCPKRKKEQPTASKSSPATAVSSVEEETSSAVAFVRKIIKL